MLFTAPVKQIHLTIKVAGTKTTSKNISFYKVVDI